MTFILLSFITALCGALVTLSVPRKFKKYAALATVTAAALLYLSASVTALRHGTLEMTMQAGFPLGSLPLRVDALSAFFLIVINFTLVTGIWYGIYYMKMYNSSAEVESMHWVSFIFLQAAMAGACTVQNIIAFLITWEIMTVAAFLLVTFEHEKRQTIRAGFNYFIQSHISVLLLITGFIWISSLSGSTDMQQIMDFASGRPAGMGPWPFIILFSGFAFKSGFVPFHTWLPRAHPAAPSHVSGIMSGVIIKMGIYGIFRVLPLCHGNMLAMGRFVLIFSVCSALYGVMLAIVQHNLKRLLAYHSIENIGIIGMGIGLGLMGTGMGNTAVAMAGYCGALLHTLNHSLFKSLLFYSAGTVYRMTHTVNIEQLGGLMKRMPLTAVLFLVPALAITGLPPLNGFISEYLIYSSMYNGLTGGIMSASMLLLCCIFGLVMVGGLAFLCFTKAFGIVFLGSPRHETGSEISDPEAGALIPQFIIMALMFSIGLFPAPFVQLAARPAMLIINGSGLTAALPATGLMYSISVAGTTIILAAAAILGIKFLVTRKTGEETSPVWGCGYTAPTHRLQYTATSFVQSYINIASPVLSVRTESPVLKGIFPGPGSFRSHSYDKIEEKLIDRNLQRFGKFLNIFGFLQNGLVQYYILYGVLFIMAILAFTFRQAIFSFFISFFALG